MQRVRGAGLEIRDEVLVEGARFLRLCMNQQGTAADLAGDLQEAQQHVTKQGGAQAPAFVALVNAEPRQEGDGLRVPACALFESERADSVLSWAIPHA